jgi:hypothetical protein
MTRTSQPLPLLALAISLFTFGCQDRPPVGVDLSTPRSAALVYLKAIQRADSATARSVSVGSPDQKRWVDSLTIMINGLRSYDNALYAKFGKMSHQVHTDLADSLMLLADGPVTWIGEDGIPVFDDTHARIDPKGKSFAARKAPSIYLSRGKTGWMVNLQDTYAQGATPEQLRQIAASYDLFREIGQAMRAAAGDVLAGKFHSIDEASQALAERMKGIKSDALSG